MSSSQSNVRQKGLAQRAATKRKGRLRWHVQVVRDEEVPTHQHDEQHPGHPHEVPDEPLRSRNRDPCAAHRSALRRRCHQDALSFTTTGTASGSPRYPRIVRLTRPPSRAYRRSLNQAAVHRSRPVAGSARVPDAGTPALLVLELNAVDRPCRGRPPSACRRSSAPPWPPRSAPPSPPRCAPASPPRAAMPTSVVPQLERHIDARQHQRVAHRHRSGVRFAPITAATCATASTSPFAARPCRISATVSGAMRHPAGGDGDALRLVLLPDVDHARPPRVVEMRQSTVRAALIRRPSSSPFTGVAACSRSARAVHPWQDTANRQLARRKTSMDQVPDQRARPRPARRRRPRRRDRRVRRRAHPATVRQSGPGTQRASRTPGPGLAARPTPRLGRIRHGR